jgi:hypothetical protein
MKKIILNIITLLTFVSAYSQSNVQEAQYKYGDTSLNKFLSKKFDETARKYAWPPCIISVVFAKFTIDRVGNVKSLTFSELKGTPQVFRTMLESTILATNGLWIPRKINDKAVESKPFLLPLIYDMESGCSVKGTDGKPVFRAIPNELDTALLYILNFENNVGSKPTQLDCILLQPLHIFSIN